MVRLRQLRGNLRPAERPGRVGQAAGPHIGQELRSGHQGRTARRPGQCLPGPVPRRPEELGAAGPGRRVHRGRHLLCVQRQGPQPGRGCRDQRRGGSRLATVCRLYVQHLEVPGRYQRIEHQLRPHRHAQAHSALVVGLPAAGRVVRVDAGRRGELPDRQLYGNAVGTGVSSAVCRLECAHRLRHQQALVGGVEREQRVRQDLLPDHRRAGMGQLLRRSPPRPAPLRRRAAAASLRPASRTRWTRWAAARR